MPEITISSGRIQYPCIESVCDYGFKWRMYETAQKMKILGTECQRIMMRNKIQSREYLRDGGIGGTLYDSSR